MGRKSDTQSSRSHFTLLAGGVLVSHTLVTILEERLFNMDSFKQRSGGAFMTLFMYTFTVLVYLPQQLGAVRRLPRESARLLFLVATLYVGTTTLTKTSLRYIDMPTQTVLKSAKLLPVMAGSIVILGKRYSYVEWVAALMLCGGIVVFNLSTHHHEFNQSLAGAACIAVALTCDALLGNYQQKAMTTASVSPDGLMLVQSSFGCVYMLFVTLADGTLLPGIRMLFDDPAVSGTMVVWAVAITIGTSLVLRLVGSYSAVAAIVVTTARKALTLIASFVLFPKQVGIGHPIGAALVFGSAFVAQRKKKRSSGDTGNNGGGNAEDSMLSAAAGMDENGGSSTHGRAVWPEPEAVGRSCCARV